MCHLITLTDANMHNVVTEHVPNVRVDEVSKVGGIDALDIFHVDRRKVMVVLTSFLTTDDNNGS